MSRHGSESSSRLITKRTCRPTGPTTTQAETSESARHACRARITTGAGSYASIPSTFTRRPVVRRSAPSRADAHHRCAAVMRSRSSRAAHHPDPSQAHQRGRLEPCPEEREQEEPRAGEAATIGDEVDDQRDRQPDRQEQEQHHATEHDRRDRDQTPADDRRSRLFPAHPRCADIPSPLWLESCRRNRSTSTDGVRRRASTRSSPTPRQSDSSRHFEGCDCVGNRHCELLQRATRLSVASPATWAVTCPSTAERDRLPDSARRRARRRAGGPTLPRGTAP